MPNDRSAGVYKTNDKDGELITKLSVEPRNVFKPSKRLIAKMIRKENPARLKLPENKTAAPKRGVKSENRDLTRRDCASIA